MTLRKFSASSISTGAKSSKLWDGETFPGYFESIATVIVPSSGQATIEFTNIPNNYAHLQIRLLARQTGANNFTIISINLNSDSGANYSRHGITGDGSTVSAYSGNSTSSAQLSQYIVAANQPASVYGSLVVDILDYTNTNKNTTIRSFGGSDANGAGGIGLGSVLWVNTSAVTRIDINSGSTSFAQYSHFALYGIRSA